MNVAWHALIALICCVDDGSVAIQQHRVTIEAEDGDIFKRPKNLDASTYRAVKLENGLRALLVSRPYGTTAAFSFRARVGWLSEPEDLPGLAQLCRRTLFRDFVEFLSANNGSSVNSTGSGSTDFSFDFASSSLQDALQQFSSLVRNAHFHVSAMESEIDAIEAEYKQAKFGWLFYLDQVCISLSDEGHPIRRFFMGNEKSLRTLPTKQGIDMMERLSNFFDFFAAGQISLCVIGPYSLKKLQDWVRDSFGSLGAGAKQSPKSSLPAVNPWSQQQSSGIAHWINVVRTTNIRWLCLIWPVVFKSIALWREWVLVKPWRYIQVILQKEYAGSLAELLYDSGWLAAYFSSELEGETFSHELAWMRIFFHVTEKGLAHRDELVEMVHAVLKQLRTNFPTDILEEIMGDVNKRWYAGRRAPRSEPSKFDASRYTANMEQHLLTSEVLSADEFYHRPENRSIQAAVAELLESMTPSKALYVSMAPEHASTSTTKEQWYGTEYSKVAVPTEIMARWMHPVRPTAWKMPPANPYMPRNFSLKNPPSNMSTNLWMIQNDSRWRVFFRAMPAAPVADVFIKLWIPQDSFSSKVFFLVHVFVMVLRHRLAKTLVPIAELASRPISWSPVSLSFGVLGIDTWRDDVKDATPDQTNLGVCLRFSGFSDRLKLLIQDVLKVFDKLVEPRHDVVEEFVKAVSAFKSYCNSRTSPFWRAGMHAKNLTWRALTGNEYSTDSFCQWTQSIHHDQFVTFSKMFWSSEQQLFGQALIHGNLEWQDAAEIQALLNSLPFQASSKYLGLARFHHIQVPPGQDYLYAEAVSATRHALEVTYSFGNQPQQMVHAALLDTISLNRFHLSGNFDSSTRLLFFESVAYLQFIWLSKHENFTADKLMESFDQFLHDLRKFLTSLSSNQLDWYKARTIRMLHARSRPGDHEHSVLAKSKHWWHEITSFQYKWTRRETEDALLTSMTHAEVVRFFDDAIAAGAPLRRRFVVAAVGDQHHPQEVVARLKSHAREFAAHIIDANPIRFYNEMPKWPFVFGEPSSSGSHAVPLLHTFVGLPGVVGVILAVAACTLVGVTFVCCLSRRCRAHPQQKRASLPVIELSRATWMTPE